MTAFLKGLRNAAAVALAWAAGWALAGLAIGVASLATPFLPWAWFFGEVFDAPLPALAVPGFFSGLIFAALVALGACRRAFHAWPYALAIAAGAAAGMLLVALPVLARLADGLLLPVALMVLIGTLGAVAGAVSLACARAARRRGSGRFRTVCVR